MERSHFVFHPSSVLIGPWSQSFDCSQGRWGGGGVQSVLNFLCSAGSEDFREALASNSSPPGAFQRLPLGAQVPAANCISKLLVKPLH